MDKNNLNNFYNYLDFFIYLNGDIMSKIGIFDSGLGGITVLDSFIKYFPNNDYIFVSDSKNFPYGNKTKEELLNCSIKIINFLISNDVDTIIIACNTLSSLVHDDLKKIYPNITIKGVIDSTINKVLEYDNKNVLVLATFNTVNSLIYKTKIEGSSSNKVFQIGTDLATLIEESSPLLENKIKEYLSMYKDIDIIVLGCTHYKLISNIIRKYSNALIISSSDEVVFNVKLDNNSIGSVVLYNTLDDITFKNRCKKLIDKDINYLNL